MADDFRFFRRAHIALLIFFVVASYLAGWLIVKLLQYFHII